MPIQQEQYLDTLEEARQWRQSAKQLYEATRQILETARRKQIVGTIEENLEVLLSHWQFPSDTEITYYSRYYAKHAKRNLRARFQMQARRSAAQAPLEPQAPIKMPEVVEDALTPEQAEQMFRASPPESSGTWPLEELEKFLAEQGDK